MRYVVLGGGIAGVCCALELARCLQQEQRQFSPVASRPTNEPRWEGTDETPSDLDDHVILVSSSSVLKGVREVARLSRLVEELEVVETPLESLAAGAGLGAVLRVVRGTAVRLHLQARELQLQEGTSLRYDKLCLCTGARPKELDVPGSKHPAVMTLRDTDSVEELARRLRGCRRLLLIGNGGIALELAGALLRLQDPRPPHPHSHLPPPPRPPPPPPPPGPHTEGDGPGELAPEGAAAMEEAAEQPPTREPAGEAAAGCSGAGSGAATAPAGAAVQPELVWVLKHGHVGDAFFDLDAAEFLLQDRLMQDRLQPAGVPAAAVAAAAAAAAAAPAAGARCSCGSATPSAGQRVGAAEGPQRASEGVLGHAAGPAWTRQLLRGLAAAQEPQPATQVAAAAAAQEAAAEQEQEQEQEQDPSAGQEAAAAAGGGAGEVGVGGGGAGFRLVLELSATVTRIEDGLAGAGHIGATSVDGTCLGGNAAEGSGAAGAAPDGGPWAVHVTLSNGKVYGADLVVCGIGVVPATEWLPAALTRGSDGGVAVRRDLRTCDPHVFAAGDCCCAEWPDGSPHWLQMRLWTQARVMGTFAAHSMLGLADELASGFNFELFTHVTRFLGAKVVLLGLYNGQRLEHEPREDVRLYSRVAPAADGSGNAFVRVILLRGRMQGATLIGETELEEALENVILDGLDLSMYGPHILDDDFHLDHVFD